MQAWSARIMDGWAADKDTAGVRYCRCCRGRDVVGRVQAQGRGSGRAKEDSRVGRACCTCAVGFAYSAAEALRAAL